jgi:SHS2 domain-containing protein
LEAFREIDHSGDVGIEATGADFVALLENLTQGLFALQYRGPVGREIERTIEVSSQSHADVVVDWLSEVIALCGARGELYSQVEVGEASEGGARGILRGERFNEAQHQPRFDVKAVTYHKLDVTHDDHGWHARVIFDL